MIVIYSYGNVLTMQEAHDLYLGMRCYSINDLRENGAEILRNINDEASDERVLNSLEHNDLVYVERTDEDLEEYNRKQQEVVV